MQIGLLQGNVPIQPADVEQALNEFQATDPATPPALVCLPEIFHSNYSTIDQVPLALDSPLLRSLSSILQSHPATLLAGSLALEEPGGRPNTLTILHAGGAIPLYRKLHLFQPMNESALFLRGDRLGILDLHLALETWRVGFAICYDLRFPELFRLLAAEGCGLIVVVAQWPARRIAAWRTLLQARAMENQIFVAGVNRSGADESYAFGGNSMAVAPDGSILGALSEEPGNLLVSLDPGQIETSRRQFCSLEERRSDVYRLHGGPFHTVGLSLPHKSK